jgi:hypothetical protein
MSRFVCGLTLLTVVLFIDSGTALAQALPAPQIPKPQNEVAKPGVVELRSMANQAFTAKDYPAFRRAMVQLHQLRPNNSEYMYQLVLAYALEDEKSSAFNLMLQMQRQGLSYDFNQAPESVNLRSTELYPHLNDLMIEAGQPNGSATAVLTLNSDIVLPEAIEWDDQREAFLIGTVRDGTITAVTMEGAHQELLRADDSNGIWSIYDLIVDQERDRLWASSASTQQFSGFDPVDKGRSVLLEFERSTMKLIKRYPVPVDGRPHVLGNMALAPNGDLFISDSSLPMVYVKRAGEAKLKPFFASRNLVSLRGIDISDDGKKLYVADYEMGIVVVDLDNEQSFSLGIPETLNLGGIDGLNFWNGHLIIIQNGISPERIMRLELDETGQSVSSVAPLAVALDIMNFPNYGTVIGDDLYFFASSHWGLRAADRKPVTIASLSIEAAPALTQPGMEKFMEQYEKRRKLGDSGAMAGGLPDLSPGQEKEKDPDGGKEPKEKNP